MGKQERPELSPEMVAEERRLRRVRFLADLTLSVIYQQHDLTLSEAMNLVNNTRRTILSMFPGKELAYDLLYRPRFDRAIAERFHQCPRGCENRGASREVDGSSPYRT